MTSSSSTTSTSLGRAIRKALDAIDDVEEEAAGSSDSEQSSGEDDSIENQSGESEEDIPLSQLMWMEQDLIRQVQSNLYATQKGIRISASMNANDFWLLLGVYSTLPPFHYPNRILLARADSSSCVG